MIIIHSKRFFKWFTKSWVSGIALFPFIIFRQKECFEQPILINHEKIHIRQQAELLVILFFIWYGIEYLFRLWHYKDSYKAYKNISFEREAYHNENDLNYLKKRRFWSFLQYI